MSNMDTKQTLNPNPSAADIAAAYTHGLWLRSQTCGVESRMLADLASAHRTLIYRNADLERALRDLVKAEKATRDEFGPAAIFNLEQAMDAAEKLAG